MGINTPLLTQPSDFNVCSAAGPRAAVDPAAGKDPACKERKLRRQEKNPNESQCPPCPAGNIPSLSPAHPTGLPTVHLQIRVRVSFLPSLVAEGRMNSPTAASPSLLQALEGARLNLNGRCVGQVSEARAHSTFILLLLPPAPLLPWDPAPSEAFAG